MTWLSCCRSLHRIAGWVVRDLIPQKFVNRRESLWFLRPDENTSALFEFFKRILDVGFELLHHRHARRKFSVDEHRSLEIARTEHLRDVAEMHPDLSAAFSILGIVGSDLDRSAVGV